MDDDGSSEVLCTKVYGVGLILAAIHSYTTSFPILKARLVSSIHSFALVNPELDSQVAMVYLV
jgi:hypothetical protein